MPENLFILSRRSLLKASSFLAAAVVVVPAAAAPVVPEVLTTLLAEYVDAAKDINGAHERFCISRQAKSKALEDAALYFRWPDGTYGRIGDAGNTYDPKYALAYLKNERTKALAVCDAGQTGEVVRTYAKTARQLRRLSSRYEAIVAGTDYPAALDADCNAFDRFLQAKKALCAYRPATMPEVAALIRCISAVGAYPGTHTGLMPRDLAAMLDASGVAS